MTKYLEVDDNETIHNICETLIDTYVFFNSLIRKLERPKIHELT